MNNERIEHLLELDVVVHAEETTKKKIDKDEETQKMASANWLTRSRKLAKELKNSSDTYRSMTYLDFLNVVLREGFVPIYQEHFRGGDGLRHVTEMLMVFWNDKKAILLVAESYGGSMVNRAKMYYNWVPNQKNKDWERAVQDGGLEGGNVWIGAQEVHEGMKYRLDVLQRKGYFCQWVKQPHMWLLNYTEMAFAAQKINAMKIAKFPAIVRKDILA